MHDEPTEQTAASDSIPPIHPQTSMGGEFLLKRSAGFPGMVVGRGDHSCALYAIVGSGPAHGKAVEVPNTALRMSNRVDEGIAKMFIVIVGSKKRRSCEQSWKRAFEDYRIRRGVKD